MNCRNADIKKKYDCAPEFDKHSRACKYTYMIDFKHNKNTAMHNSYTKQGFSNSTCTFHTSWNLSLSLHLHI